MPISLRKFNLKHIIDRRDKENEAIEKAKGNTTMKDMIRKMPDVPDYVTKTPKTLAK